VDDVDEDDVGEDDVGEDDVGEDDVGEDDVGEGDVDMGQACHPRATMPVMRFILNSIIMAVAVWFVTILPFDVEVHGGEDSSWGRLLVFLLVGALMAAAFAIIYPIVKVLAFPLLILTLGLFSLVIAWFMLWFTAWLTTLVPWAELSIGGFWDTLWAALVIAVTTGILGAVIPGAGRD
jgi:putative membrane protein